MDDTFILNNKIYSNNNNLLLEIVIDLHQLINYSKDNLIIKILGNVINKMNYIINENKKNIDLIRNNISSILKKFDELKNNNTINNQQLQHADGIYIGQVVNGLAEGKGVWYGTKEHCVGDRHEGDYRNGKKEGKGIYYYNNGDRYEGDWRNDKKEGKGIFYYNNGDREMADFYNDKPIGKHVTLTKNGEIKINNL